MIIDWHSPEPGELAIKMVADENKFSEAQEVV